MLIKEAVLLEPAQGRNQGVSAFCIQEVLRLEREVKRETSTGFPKLNFQARSFIREVPAQHVQHEAVLRPRPSNRLALWSSEERDRCGRIVNGLNAEPIAALVHPFAEIFTQIRLQITPPVTDSVAGVSVCDTITPAVWQGWLDRTRMPGNRLVHAADQRRSSGARGGE
jgi:hypothetical protein